MERSRAGACFRSAIGCVLRSAVHQDGVIRRFGGRRGLGAAVQQLNIGCFDPVFGNIAVAVVDAHGITDIQQRRLCDLRRFADSLG